MISSGQARSRLSRRDFFRLTGAAVSGLAFGAHPSRAQPQFPQADLLGRITVGKMDVFSKPDGSTPPVAAVYEDNILPWLRAVVGNMPGRINQRFIETPDGFVWGGYVQPVRNQPNVPVAALPQTSIGPGTWVEVTVPYVDLMLDNPPARAPWLQYVSSINLPARFYFSQVVWVDAIRTEPSGRISYRLNEKYGSGDIFWAPAEAFRPLIAEDAAPINPDTPDKRILIRIWNQTLSCFEGNTEVHFARISSGALFDAWGNRVDAWETPLGEFPIWRKAISLPLSGGSASAGWSLPADGWISLFVGSGVAIHSTYWHNNYGEPSSRGCVNASPDDAKWIFRWSQPTVPLDPGDVTVGMPGGTKVTVQEEPA